MKRSSFSEVTDEMNAKEGIIVGGQVGREHL